MSKILLDPTSDVVAWNVSSPYTDIDDGIRYPTTSGFDANVCTASDKSDSGDWGEWGVPNIGNYPSCRVVRATLYAAGLGGAAGGAAPTQGDIRLGGNLLGAKVWDGNDGTWWWAVWSGLNIKLDNSGLSTNALLVKASTLSNGDTSYFGSAYIQLEVACGGAALLMMLMGEGHGL